jgi:hypothetical protein
MLSSGEFENEVRMVHPIALGNAISREHCEYKTAVDIRVCRDLDTGAKRREEKDLSGSNCSRLVGVRVKQSCAVN